MVGMFSSRGLRVLLTLVVLLGTLRLWGCFTPLSFKICLLLPLETLMDRMNLACSSNELLHRISIQLSARFHRRPSQKDSILLLVSASFPPPYQVVQYPDRSFIR